MKSIRWLSPILDLSGYATAARGYLTAAESVGIAVQARCRSRSLNLKNVGIDAKTIEDYNRLYLTNVPNDCPCVQHQVPDCFFKDSKTKYSIGYTIFEMTRIPLQWVPFCNSMDVIWTGSKYSADAFRNSGVTKPITVLPHAIDVNLFSPDGPKWQIENRRKFAFLSVFDFTERKAWKELLKAYWTAFDKNSDVCLILKVYFSDFSDESRANVVRKILKYRRELGLGERAPILIYGYDIGFREMPSLYRSADCYVSISREGFGLTYAEAMACGLPCIGPEVGGTREFMTEANSYLVKYEGDEPISKEMERLNPAFDGLRWATHSWENLKEVMIKVVEDDATRTTKALAGLADVRSNLNNVSIGHRMEALIPD